MEIVGLLNGFVTFRPFPVILYEIGQREFPQTVTVLVYVLLYDHDLLCPQQTNEIMPGTLTLTLY